MRPMQFVTCATTNEISKHLIDAQNEAEKTQYRRELERLQSQVTHIVRTAKAGEVVRLTDEFGDTVDLVAFDVEEPAKSKLAQAVEEARGGDEPPSGPREYA